RALKSLIVSLHLVAVDRGGGECGGGCEDKSVCAWEDKTLSAFMVKKSAWREYLAGVFGGSIWREYLAGVFGGIRIIVKSCFD
ncbi:hypothetical protein Tco_1579889, partial [Tanacetum coccineum]